MSKNTRLIINIGQNHQIAKFFAKIPSKSPVHYCLFISRDTLLYGDVWLPLLNFMS